jgi:hypothetical protein
MRIIIEIKGHAWCRDLAPGTHSSTVLPCNLVSGTVYRDTRDSPISARRPTYMPPRRSGGLVSISDAWSYVTRKPGKPFRTAGPQ